MHAEFVQDFARVGEHIHQMRDRRALITAYVGDSRLQQGLGDGEYGLALEYLAGSEFKRLNFPCERPLRHGSALSVPD